MKISWFYFAYTIVKNLLCKIAWNQDILWRLASLFKCEFVHVSEENRMNISACLDCYRTSLNTHQHHLHRIVTGTQQNLLSFLKKKMSQITWFLYRIIWLLNPYKNIKPWKLVFVIYIQHVTYSVAWYSWGQCSGEAIGFCHVLWGIPSQESLNTAPVETNTHEDNIWDIGNATVSCKGDKKMTYMYRAGID